MPNKTPYCWKEDPKLGSVLVLVGGIAMGVALYYCIDGEHYSEPWAKFAIGIPFAAFAIGLIVVSRFIKIKVERKLIKKTLLDKGSWLLHFAYTGSDAIITAKGYFNTDGKNHVIIDKSKKEVEYDLENAADLIQGDFLDAAVPKVQLNIDIKEFNPQFISFRKRSLDLTYNIPGKFIHIKVVEDKVSDTYTDTEITLPIPDNMEFNEDIYNAFLLKLNGIVPFYSLIENQ